jgi:hypothetical protein
VVSAAQKTKRQLAMVCSRYRKPIMPGVNVVPLFPLWVRPKDTPTTVYRFVTVEGPKGQSCLITMPLRPEMVTLKEGEKLTPLRTGVRADPRLGPGRGDSQGRRDRCLDGAARGRGAAEAERPPPLMSQEPLDLPPACPRKLQRF